MSSWHHFVTGLYKWCVETLNAGANLLGISYHEINIWIFCIIEPIAFVVMFAVIVWQWRKIKRLNNRSA